MGALERARAAYGTGAYDDATIEFLFPEVKESEDERIRKFLVKHVSEWIGCIEHDLRVSPKDVESEKELAMFKDGLDYLEKQREQKPAEWNEEDKDYFDAIIVKLEITQDDAMLTDNQMDFLKSLPDRFNLQPKQEWSEEDEEKITFLERLIRYNVPEGQYGWVDGHKGGFVTKLEAISILKSLRPLPHWKPSEEQMRFLLAVINEPNNAGSESCHIILNSLYHDLQNLH